MLLVGAVLCFDLCQGISCEAGLVTRVSVAQEANNCVMTEWSGLRLLLQQA